MEAYVKKLCCVCGLDVRQLRRIKDPRGRYFCNPCWHAKIKAHRRRLASIAANSAIHEFARDAGSPSLSHTSMHSQFERPVAPASDSSAAAASILLPVGPTASRARFILLACVVPVLACALAALTLDRIPEIRVGAIAGLIVCTAIVAVMWMPSDRRIRLRDVLMYGAGLVTISAAAVAAVRLGWWRAGFWGSAWMGGAVLVAATAWLAAVSRRNTRAPADSESDDVTFSSPSDSLTMRQGTFSVMSKGPAIRSRWPAVQRGVRISDLLSDEARAAAEAARNHPERIEEPEIPVSPLTNPPVTALVEDYSRMLIPHPAVAHAQLHSAR